MEEFERKVIKTNDIHLHVVVAGPEDGPLLILLHGFPEFWYAWNAQIPALAAAGYRVYAPDMRGYNLSDKPQTVADYKLDTLVADIIGLIDASGREKAYLVAHDWGAIVAWNLAIQHPERLEKLVIINVPHPLIFQQTLRRNPRQLAHSWYVFFFQIPWLPEKLMSLRDWQFGRRTLVGTSKPGSFKREDLIKYKEAWSQPRAMTSMINYYRALARHFPKLPADSRVKVPTLVIWGAHDVALIKEMAQPSADMAINGRLEMFNDATHWVQHDEPEKVSQLILDFFNATV